MKHQHHSYSTIAGTLFATLLMIFLAPIAAAVPSETDHAIEIHKLEQPSELTTTAVGLPQDVSGHAPVSGSTFTAQRVPGIDVLTNQGQRDAGNLNVAEAAQRVANQQVAAQAITDAHGRASLSSLASGVYYVQETDTPNGYTGSEPFLVVLPMTHPVDRDDWLSTVHVYPKDAAPGVTLDVIDQDAVKLGDSVQWISRSDIPRQASLHGYRVDQVINANLNLVGINALHAAVAVSLDCDDCPALVAGDDYELSYDAATGTLATRFLASGLRKLETASAQDPTAQVLIEYETTVHNEGAHVNDAILYPNQSAIDQQRGVSDTATTKWGSLAFLIHEHGHRDHLIAGARFELYLSLEDAHARQYPVVIDGVSEWTTDEHGRVLIHGLRFSNFVNGLDREPSDPLYRLYWAVPTYVPEDWSLVDDTPLAGVVNDTVDYQTLIFEVLSTTAAPPESDEPAVPGKPPAEGGMMPPPRDGDIAMTGAQIMGLLVLAAALVVTGLLLLRRRRASHDQSGNVVP